MLESFDMQLEIKKIKKKKYFYSKSHWFWHLWGFFIFVLYDSTADAAADFLGDINIS